VTPVIEDTTKALGCDLAAEVAGKFGRVRIRVLGTSMAPAILPGDVLSVVRADAAQVSPGEIVVFTRPGRIVAHRVVAKRNEPGGVLITQGDRLRREDAPVFGDELIGRVTQVERRGARINVPSGTGMRWRMICRFLRFSDLATSLYLRFAAFQTVDSTF
jgi:signal peptidase I